MGRLDGKVVLITGAAQGQGAVEARLAAEDGARVVLSDVLDAPGEELAAEIGGAYHHLDVTSSSGWDGVIAEVLRTHGRIDGLVNNAAIYVASTLADRDDDTFRRVVEVNQTGVYLGMAAAGPAMREQGSGSIVNISSVAGMRGFRSIAYVASKWAVRGMTKSAAVELAPYGVRVNSVHPGSIETEMLNNLGPEYKRRVVSRVPMGRAGDAAEVARVVLFLLSDDSSYVTGAELLVDGGMLAT